MDSPVPRGVCGTATPTPRSSPGNETWRRQSSHWSCQHGIAASPSGSLRPPLPNLLGMYLAKPGDAQRDVSPCSRANSRGRREGDYLRGDGDSIMGEVQDRIREMEARMALDVESDTHEGAVMAHVRTNRTNPSGVTGIAASGWTEDSQGEEKKPRPKRCRIPFRPAIIMTVAFGALLTCVLMFLPLYEFTTQLQTKTAESFGKSVNRQFGLIEELTSRAATASHRSILGRIRNLLWETVMEPPDRAIDALWGTMQMSHSFDPAWTGQTEKQRAAMAYRAFLELQQQQKEANHTHRQTGAADFLYVAFQGGDFSGTSFRLRDEDTQKGYKAKWFDCPLHSSTAEDTFLELGVVKKDPECNEKFPLKRPWYTLQSNMADIGGPLKRMWSGLYVYLDGTTIGLTKTAPVAYCGDYSCFEGVIAADITLKVVGQSCDEAFVTLQQELMASAYQFPINRSNAVVFVVSQLTRGQQAPGVLVGASHLQLDQIVMAQHSSEVCSKHNRGFTRSAVEWIISVRPTLGVVISNELLRAGSSRSLLKIERDSNGFAQWIRCCVRRFLGRAGLHQSTQGLRCMVLPLLMGNEEQLFRFRAANGSTDCGVEFSQFTDPECLQVGTLSVQLDEVDRWLVVIVSPAVAFFTLAKHIEENVMEELEGVTILQSAALAFFVTTALTVGIGFGLGTAVSSPLRELTFLLRRLGHLDFGRFGVCLQAKAGSSIRDICEVQDAFCRLSMGIQTFARFVPEAVVRNIIKGDCRAARLHVTKREVTIMFSDIKDFTAMSETMKQTDLIFLLTRYLSIMSRIVETFGGVVAEILGDGLLVYWNTPLDVEDHAVKACAAAVAMQQALGPLNYEITECKLEPLKVRIGVNTGEVLSGTFGSDLKMKFGCMGDPVNLASRLEGLCKVYDAGIIVSGTTYDSIANSGFICRKLDLVQVKGRKEPVMVYEVMGCDLACDPCPFLHEMTADDSQSSSPRRGRTEIFMGQFRTKM
ncbi:unnamed protein product [Cladocopium goreaui]|uniref:Guanylate cyclase domain-containing protein n=1 Tax=Cladocopium goreaui TaxID=2562237 RepID=A0A9P1D548_9DINO|nr:unnamed protein product [Cladocopium goreaui]